MRLGHALVLTVHRTVIHCARAASLRRSLPKPFHSSLFTFHSSLFSPLPVGVYTRCTFVFCGQPGRSVPTRDSLTLHSAFCTLHFSIRAERLSVTLEFPFRIFVREFLKGVWGKHNISLAKYYRSNGTLRCSSARSFPHVPYQYLLTISVILGSNFSMSQTSLSWVRARSRLWFSRWMW